MYLYCVTAGLPSCGGVVVVYVFDINHPSLPTPFYFVLVSVSGSVALSTVFHRAFSLSSSDHNSALLVLSTIGPISLWKSSSALMYSFVVDRA